MEKAYQICFEMFEQRGYNIIEQDEDKITAIKEDGKHICAFMANTPKFNVERVQEYISLMNELNITHSIVVYKETATPMAKKVVSSSNEMIIELFTEEELQYNITKHILVPLHQKLSKEETAIFKKKYGVKFPTLLKNDPISRFYGYERGDIIKVTRKGGYITYRIVKG
jgi:DNA-directed RNA polymerase I, II, and III subunit RPABC1